MSRFDVRWKALISGNLLDTLSVILSHVKTFLETLEVEKCLKTDQNSEISKVSVGSEKQDLRHFLTSSGSKNVFTGDMITLKVFKDCPRPGLSSEHQIVTLRTVKVKLSFRKRAKDQILFFRAN